MGCHALPLGRVPQLDRSAEALAAQVGLEVHEVRVRLGAGGQKHRSNIPVKDLITTGYWLVRSNLNYGQLVVGHWALLENHWELLANRWALLGIHRELLANHWTLFENKL